MATVSTTSCRKMLCPCSTCCANAATRLSDCFGGERARRSAESPTLTRMQSPWRRRYRAVPRRCLKGVRLLQWAPQLPPVAIESWAVVNDVLQFIQTTLSQLQAAMDGRNWLAGNRSVRELVDRLEQVGVKVSVEEIK